MELANDTVIKVEGLHKKFCRHLRRSMFYGTLDVTRDMLGWRYDTGRLRPQEFWALPNIDIVQTHCYTNTDENVGEAVHARGDEEASPLGEVPGERRRVGVGEDVEPADAGQRHRARGGQSDSRRDIDVVIAIGVSRVIEIAV